MKNLLYIILIVVPIFTMRAQHHPKRTPEDIARKQTEMLVRELEIQDSLVKDTLYRLHLKFARKRIVSHTRAEAMQYIQQANAELQQILTTEQYQQFMNQQINHEPHRPHSHCNRITYPDNQQQSHDNGEEAHTPPPPSEHQP